MRKTTIIKVGVIALLGFALHGCKKPTNGIDNNSVITKPYSLFIADASGIMYSTNDGVTFRDLDFTSDGDTVRALCTSGNNLLRIATNAWVRVGTDKNFNSIDAASNITNPSIRYQSMVLNVPALIRVYLAGNSGSGVYYSDTNGKQGTWHLDTDPALGSLVTSFTLLDDGTVVAYSDANKGIYTNTSISTPWTPVAAVTALPAAGSYFISHIKNTIVAADITTNTVWYSTNKGIDWSQYPGTINNKIISMNSVYGQALLVGTDGGGIYRLTFGAPNFVTSNYGLGLNAKVTGIVEKYNLYKNGEIRQYVYISTNTGLYRSDDLGQNWVQIVAPTLPSTSFTAVY